MKKIAIITMNGNYNYGNKLQHYAVQTILKRYYSDIETIYCFCNSNRYIHEAKHIIKYILDKRYRTFSKFDSKIKYSNMSIKSAEVPKNINDKYDFFIVGSDQVWNSSLTCFTENYLLKFVEAHKRVSFSASFGIDEIEHKHKELFTRELLKFKAISVREESGKKIVSNLTGRTDVEVLVDPTMLLTAKEWRTLSFKPKQLKYDKYILNYFLGEISHNRKLEIEKIAKENNCKIINIMDKNDPLYCSGPSEFLYLIENAYLICTDSFHASVFSVLYDKTFIVFDREQENIKNINSRIDTLISKLQLRDRRFNGKITKQNLEHDYTEAYKILEMERKKAEDFITNALNLKENKSEDK